MNEKTEAKKELQVAKSLAVKWLSRRSFFRAEIEFKLKKLEISPQVIEEVIDFCHKIGAIDDEKLKEKIIEKELRRGRGRAYALAKCRRWTPISDLDGKDPVRAQLEKDAIEKVLQKKRVDLPLLDAKGKRKLWLFLLQRGFEAELIQKVLFGSEV